MKRGKRSGEEPEVISTAEELEVTTTAEAVEKKRPCQKCRLALRKGAYKLVADGGVICRDQPACRQRVLSEELGIDLFTKYPRERLLFEMDVRPPDWKETGWKPIFTEDERVEAAWIYYSWCYPIGLAYAVQIDADDEIMHDRYGQPMMMSQMQLARIMGIPQPNICRATNRLVARKKLRSEDSRVYPVAKPTISREERGYISSDIGDIAHLGDDLSPIPPKFRKRLDDLLDQVPDDISTDIYLDRVLGFCTTFNKALTDIRTTRDQGIEQVCTELATLLSRPETLRQQQASSSYQDSSSSGPSEPLGRDDVVVEPDPIPPAPPLPKEQAARVRDRLYAAGEGRGALGKLPAERRRPDTRFSAFARVVEAAVAGTGRGLPSSRQMAEIYAAFPRAAPVEDFGPYLTAKLPRLKHAGGVKAVAEEYAREWKLVAEAEAKAASEERRRNELREQTMARQFLDNPEGVEEEHLAWARMVLGDQTKKAGGD